MQKGVRNLRLRNRWRRVVALCALLGALAATSAGCAQTNVAIGDSITDLSREEIQRNFDYQGWSGGVVAFPGQRIDWMRLMAVHVADQTPRLRRVFFFGGTNDALQYASENFDLAQSVHHLQATAQDVLNRRPYACIFLVTVRESIPGRYNDAARYLNEIIRQLDNSYARVHVIDWNALTAGRAEWFTDPVHPNRQGQQQLADYYTWIGSQYQCGPPGPQ